MKLHLIDHLTSWFRRVPDAWFKVAPFDYGYLRLPFDGYKYTRG